MAVWPGVQTSALRRATAVCHSIRLLLLRYYDLYRVRGEFSSVEDVGESSKATAIGSLLIVAAAFMYRGGVAYRTFLTRAQFLCSIFCLPSRASAF